MKRRDFLRTAAAVALSSATLRAASAQMMGSPGMRMGPRPPRGPGLPAGLPLRPLESLPNVAGAPGRFEASLTAAPFTASLVASRATELWGYNGAFPGPAIELREGTRAAIRFANRLALDSTIHWHGLEVPPGQDGSPMDPVAPGTARVYEFDVPFGSAGTYWYHPHAHETVTLQAAHGLTGPLIVRSADDPLAALPEVTLMVNALALDANGQVVTVPGGAMGMGAMGGDLLVNGQNRPVRFIAPGATERWRIVNATADRYLRLALDGHDFAVVGTDGGLLGAPLRGRSEWLLAPAQRVEIVVRVTEAPQARFALRDLGYDGGMGMGGAGAEILTIVTGHAAPQPPIPLPATLRPIADLGAPAARQRLVLSGMGMGMMGRFLINGRTFDMHRVDLETVAGRVELWDLVNASTMDHPIHIHGTQFQVVSQTVRGATVAAPYLAWLDTVNVPAGETVTIKTRQSMPGPRMVHCHILPHEDAGMMAVLAVRAA